ncbi:Nucleoporin seh1-A [Porphyridium purpureum]|uniref:Nucleoporin seh1-A n=1 Tax=Porphyridium purpureum TaxID=35688 RepID=A0A5J4Z7H6_PORPP|nr:Nucleoporin seh1-A [Porphyridium purpureum]|eukprot:POR1343..scf295_1
MLHEDTVHDIAYDYYGVRVATCSSDRKIKLWEQGPGGANSWECVAAWVAHEGPILRVCWAPPHACGPGVLASCSTDRKVVLWEERSSSSSVSGGQPTVNANGESGVLGGSTTMGSAALSNAVATSNSSTGNGWLVLAQLVDARDDVTGIAFRHASSRLLLAAASADGMFRVYEAIDLANLHQWPLVFETFGAGVPRAGALRCVAWYAPTVAEQDGALHALVIGAEGHHAFVWVTERENNWCLAMVLDTSSGISNGGDENGGDSNDEAVLDVAWAPFLGFGKHLVAAGTRSGKVCVFEVGTELLSRAALARTEKEIYVKPAAVLIEHVPNSVQRVSWNITGALLSSSDCTGGLKLWQSVPGNSGSTTSEWHCVGGTSSPALQESRSSSQQ